MGMEIGAVQIPGMDIGSTQSSITTFSGSINLFILGQDTKVGDINLFVNGRDTKNQDINLFIGGFEANNNNINLFIHGKIQENKNIDLTITGHESSNKSLDLFIPGKDTIIDNLTLFIIGEEISNSSLTLFIKGIDSESDNNFGITLDQLFKNADYSPQIIGRFITNPSSVTIEMWSLMDNNSVVSLTGDDCYEIGNTDRWAWSTINLPPLTRRVNQYVFKMTANTSEVFEGEFILKTKKVGKERKRRK